MEIKLYVAPQVEIIEIEVEKGFAQSGGAVNESVGDSGNRIPF